MRHEVHKLLLEDGEGMGCHLQEEGTFGPNVPGVDPISVGIYVGSPQLTS